MNKICKGNLCMRRYDLVDLTEYNGDTSDIFIGIPHMIRGEVVNFNINTRNFNLFLKHILLWRYLNDIYTIIITNRILPPLLNFKKINKQIAYSPLLTFYTIYEEKDVNVEEFIHDYYHSMFFFSDYRIDNEMKKIVSFLLEKTIRKKGDEKLFAKYIQAVVDSDKGWKKLVNRIEVNIDRLSMPVIMLGEFAEQLLEIPILKPFELSDKNLYINYKHRHARSMNQFAISYYLHKMKEDKVPMTLISEEMRFILYSSYRKHNIQVVLFNATGMWDYTIDELSKTDDYIFVRVTTYKKGKAYYYPAKIDLEEIKQI